MWISKVYLYIPSEFLQWKLHIWIDDYAECDYLH